MSASACATAAAAAARSASAVATRASARSARALACSTAAAASSTSFSTSGASIVASTWPCFTASPMSTPCVFRKPETLAYRSTDSNACTDPGWIVRRCKPPRDGRTTSTRVPADASAVAIEPGDDPAAALLALPWFTHQATPAPVTATSRSTGGSHRLLGRAGAGFGGDVVAWGWSGIVDLPHGGSGGEFERRERRGA